MPSANRGSINISKGSCTLEEAKEKIITASKRLAKKQKTWFRHQMKTRSIRRVESDALVRDVETRLKSFYESEERHEHLSDRYAGVGKSTISKALARGLIVR